MKITPIFVPGNSEDGLWSIFQEGESQNEFDKIFDLLNDIEWLHDFFEKNADDLNNGFWGNITTGEAVLRILEEIEKMEDVLYNYTE